MSETIETVLQLRIDKIEQRKRSTWTEGAGAEAKFVDVNLGWWIVCGNIALCVGSEKPEWAIGDTLELRRAKS